jgi:hypothetical protein
MFSNNVGTADRLFRVLLGVGLLIAFFYTSGVWQWLTLIGIVPLLTGLVGTCPVYSLFGLSTCPVKRG